MTELPIVVNMTVDASRTEYDLTAESNLEEIELLNDTVIETGGSHVPVYEGPYTVDAGLSAVTLDTDGKRMTQDVTVNALTENTLSNINMSINTSNGEVTADVSLSAGYNPLGKGTIATLILPTQSARTITPTTSEQTAVARGKYTTGAVKVRAMPAGTRGTPTATKGTVSNHSVSVTPSVTNTTGYIEGGTKTGNAVSVSASELVSGNKAITQNGNNIDVANYSTVSVNVPTVTPTGTLPITQNGTYDVTNYASAEVSVPSALRPCDNYAKRVMFNGYTDSDGLPTDLYVYYPRLIDCRQMFYNVTFNNQTSITVKTDANVTNISAMFNVTKLNPACVVTFEFDTSQVTNWTNAFSPRSNGANTFKTLVGTLDFTSASGLSNLWQNNNKIESFSVAPNTIKKDFSISSAPNLTNATIVSIANGLLENGAKTLTLHSTPKGKLSTIMGTVTTNGTYSTFTEDAQGTTTLMSFITSTKGWTVA